MNVIEFKPRPKRSPSVLSRVEWINEVKSNLRFIRHDANVSENTITTYYENAHGKRYHTVKEIGTGKDLYDEATAL